MITVKTESGLEMTVHNEKMNDMNYVELAARAEKDDAIAFSKMLTIAFGEEGKQKLYDHVKTEEGLVPPMAAAEKFKEIILLAQKENAELKN